jgi:hypothetical protein
MLGTYGGSGFANSSLLLSENDEPNIINVPLSWNETLEESQGRSALPDLLMTCYLKIGTPHSTRVRYIIYFSNIVLMVRI